MDKRILDFYREFSTYTNPGLYKAHLKKELPNDIRKIGNLVRKNIIHRTTLSAGNVGTNADEKFGDMTKGPWHRQPQDDVLTTASAMLAELYLRDKKGFTANRKENNPPTETAKLPDFCKKTMKRHEHQQNI